MSFYYPSMIILTLQKCFGMVLKMYAREEELSPSLSLSLKLTLKLSALLVFRARPLLISSAPRRRLRLRRRAARFTERLRLLLRL